MEEKSPGLKREVGLRDAFFMGMGSIVGTGVFVSIGLASGLTGHSFFLALFSAMALAICNGLSTAQLAAEAPLSGGTYEYGYRHLGPLWGLSAGWLFLGAKSASAATAAMGFASYFLQVVGGSDSGWQIPLSIIVILSVFAILSLGLRRTTLMNSVIVSLTLISLLTFVFLAIGSHWQQLNLSQFRLQFSGGFSGWLQATALLFVAYTGYGRVATLGEEVKDPKKTIPRAVILTLFGVGLLYFVVALAAFLVVGPNEYSRLTQEGGAPLVEILRRTPYSAFFPILIFGALTAMFGVLLNLILGLSRVAFAMARKGDLPKSLAELSKNSRSPQNAIFFVTVIIVLLSLLGDIRLAWSVSAATVLAYYSITNLSALRLPSSHRLYPRWIAFVGLLGCLSLSFCVEWWALPLVLGLVVFALGARWLTVKFFDRGERNC